MACVLSCFNANMIAGYVKVSVEQSKRGQKFKCSPARALDTKPFSATYWQWQHVFVLDAVEQFGLPDVFITISPFEWSFPFPKWLDDLRLKCGKGPTELAGLETSHIAHILGQVVRGYLCGRNSKNGQHKTRQDTLK